MNWHLQPTIAYQKTHQVCFVYSLQKLLFPDNKNGWNMLDAVLHTRQTKYCYRLFKFGTLQVCISQLKQGWVFNWNNTCKLLCICRIPACYANTRAKTRRQLDRKIIWKKWKVSSRIEQLSSKLFKCNTIT